MSKLPTKPQSKTAPQVGERGEIKTAPKVVVPDPKPNPLKGLPPPEMPQKRKPGRPPKLAADKTTPIPETTAGPAAPTPTPTAPEGSWRRLPSDPTAAELALQPFRVQVAPMVAMVDGLCSTLPPQLPLQLQEKNGLELALANVAYAYNEDMNPLWGLAMVAAGIAIPRFLIYRQQRAQLTPPPKPEEKAAAA